MKRSRFEFELVVVGGGPAGLAAACVAAESGRDVALVEATPWLGGQIWRADTGAPASPRRFAANGAAVTGGRMTAPTPEAQRWLARFRCSGATLLDNTSVVAVPTPGVLLAEHDDGPREIHWHRLIIATGARELYLPFPGWTLPGVMGPGGLQAMVKHGWPVKGQRVVVAGSGPLLLAAGAGLREHGARVSCIAEQALWAQVMRFGLSLWGHPGKLRQGAQLKLQLRGVPYRCGVWPVRAEGNDHVSAVTLSNGRRTWSEPCDLLACGFGLVPNLELPLALGCELTDGFVRVDEWQTTSLPNVYCAGEPTGVGGVDCALVEGQIAGYAASGCQAQAGTLFGRRSRWHKFRAALAKAFALRPELKSLATNDTLLCRCEDVTFGRVRQFSDARDAKLQSRCGMGACQGRICGAAARVLFGWSQDSVRPPLLPARVESLISPAQAQKPLPQKPAESSSPNANRPAAETQPASSGELCPTRIS